MWCLSCRQDVPGVLNVAGGSHVCPRCGTLLAEDAGIDLAAAVANEALSEDSPGAEFGMIEPGTTPTNAGRSNAAGTVPDGLPETPDFEPVRPPRAEPARMTSLRWEAANWELNEKIRHVERVTAAAGTRRRFDAPAASDDRRPHFEPAARRPLPPHAEAHPPSFAPPTHSPYESPHYAPSQYPSPYGPSAPQGPGPQSPTSPYESSPHEWNEFEDDDFDPPPRLVRSQVAGSTSAELAASLLSWLFLGVAVTAFTCGGFLAGWGAMAGRSNLEKLGMPIILGGLLALVVGVLPQLFLRQAEEERARLAAQRNESLRNESRGEPRGHAGVRPPHFSRRRSRDYDRSRDDSGEY